VFLCKTVDLATKLSERTAGANAIIPVKNGCTEPPAPNPNSAVGVTLSTAESEIEKPDNFSAQRAGPIPSRTISTGSAARMMDKFAVAG
jgi:hypothetical protein